MKRVFYIIFVLFIIKTFSFAENEQTNVTLAVLEMDPVGVSDETAEIVSEILRTELFKTSLFDMVERRQIKKVLEEHSLQLTGLTGDEYQIRIGELLSADKVLVGTVGKLGETFIINARIIDVEAGKMDFAESTKVESESELDTACEEFATELVRLMLVDETVDNVGKNSPSFFSQNKSFLGFAFNPLYFMPNQTFPLFNLELKIAQNMSLNFAFLYNMGSVNLSSLFRPIVTETVYYAEWKSAGFQIAYRYYIYPRQNESLQGFWAEAGIGLNFLNARKIQVDTIDNSYSETNQIAANSTSVPYFNLNLGYKFVIGSKIGFYIEPWAGYSFSYNSTYQVAGYTLDIPLLGFKAGVGLGVVF